jgi:hypothetical protein
MPEQRVYKSVQEENKPSKKTLYLSYQLPKARQGAEVESIKVSTFSPLGHDERLSTILSQEGDDGSNKPLISQITYESKTRNTYIGEAAIRRLVVVREGINSSLCL